jgi:glycerol kinase
MVETTALGAAYLAGLTSGVYESKEELSGLWQEERRFIPQLPASDAQALMQRWEHAIRQTCAE